VQKFINSSGVRKLLASLLLWAAGMGFMMLPGALRLRNSRYRRTSLHDESSQVLSI
jgi:hypothetical protein